MDASKIFKKSRTTIYEAIKNGEISRDIDGLIDLSELIRVYGNPIGITSNVRTEQTPKDVHVHVQSEIENVLKDQVTLLKNQLDLANQREKSLMKHIEDLTHRIEFKGSLEQLNNLTTNDKVSSDKLEMRADLNKDNLFDSNNISIPEDIKKEAKKRGFFSRLFLSNE